VYKYNAYFGNTFINSVLSPTNTIVVPVIRNTNYTFKITAVAKSNTVPDIETVATGSVPLPTVAVLTPVNWGQITYEPTGNIYTWGEIAMSSGADRICAIADNAPYFSLDYGSTWVVDTDIVNSPVNGNLFSSVSMASDGLKIVISCRNGRVLVCNNLTIVPRTWVQIENSNGSHILYNAVAMSGNGNVIYAGLSAEDGSYYDSAFTSTYDGTNWSTFQRIGADIEENRARWTGLACSYDGSVVYASTGQGTYFNRYKVGDLGWSRIQSGSAGQQYTITSVCCSDDGAIGYYGTDIGGLYYLLSTSNQAEQYGDFAKIRRFRSVRCARDGTNVIGADSANGGQIVKWDGGKTGSGGGNGAVLFTNSGMVGTKVSVAVNDAGTRILMGSRRVGDNDPNLSTRRLWIGDYT
jgi:hypothetical protein